MLLLISIWIAVDVVLITSLCRVAAHADQRLSLIESRSFPR